MAELKDLRVQVQNYGVAVLEKRIERLLNRKFVLFPILRVKLLLRKLRKIETL
jgi:hypothetical protein